MGVLESLGARAILGKLVDDLGGGNIPRGNKFQGANAGAGGIEGGVYGSHANFRDLIEDFIPLGNQAPLLPTLEEGGNSGGLAHALFSRGLPADGTQGRHRRVGPFAGFDGFDDGGSVGGAALGFLLQHRHDQIDDAGGNAQAGGVFGERPGSFTHMRQEPFRLGFSLERHFAGQHFVEDDPQGIEVGAAVQIPLLNLLGRHVLRCANGEDGAGGGQGQDAGLILQLALAELGNTEVQDLDQVAVLILNKSNIFRLDISVDNT